jgi:hypothetical protein
MIVKAAEFHFPESVRIKYFPVVMRVAPPEGWPEGTIVMTEGKLPYKSFLQVIGASPKAEFRAEVGEYSDGDPRALLSVLEEIALNCPLKEEEALSIKRDYEITIRASGDERPALFVQGLIPPIFGAFEGRLLSYDAALILSLYATEDVQREIIGLGLGEESPETFLRCLRDPFFAGDLFNRLERDPGKLMAFGYESMSAFLKKRSPFSYGRARFLMRLAAAIPPERREGLTGDQGEFLLSIGWERRETLFRGGSISVDGHEITFDDLKLLGRRQVRELIHRVREESKRGDNP